MPALNKLFGDTGESALFANFSAFICFAAGFAAYVKMKVSAFRMLHFTLFKRLITAPGVS